MKDLKQFTTLRYKSARPIPDPRLTKALAALHIAAECLDHNAPGEDTYTDRIAKDTWDAIDEILMHDLRNSIAKTEKP